MSATFARKNQKERKYVAGMLKITMLETNESFARDDRRPTGFGFSATNKKTKIFVQ